MVGPEGRAGLVEIQSAEQVAAEVALVARDLLRCGTTLRHPARPPRRRTHQTSAYASRTRRGRAPGLPAIAALFLALPEEAANRRISPPPRAKNPHRAAFPLPPCTEVSLGERERPVGDEVAEGQRRGRRGRGRVAHVQGGVGLGERRSRRPARRRAPPPGRARRPGRPRRRRRAARARSARTRRRRPACWRPCAARAPRCARSAAPRARSRASAGRRRASPTARAARRRRCGA